MFEILNGRSSFWQWDINQKLVVQDLPNGAEVHFSNCNSDYALVTLVKTVDGKNVCDVPNVVLQKAGYVNVFAYVIEGEEKHTEYKASILILARSKPEDYIYTETETLCYKNLSEKIGDISQLETGAKENLVDAVNEIAKKAASGADLSLGITGAEAGQIATVEAVDDQGKPTKWKHENIAGAVGFPAPTVSDNGEYLGCENGAAKWMPVDALKGADGKSAYQYAKDGGYTGTEAEFAEKLAQEMISGTTNELTPTQVYEAVSAGIPVKVQYIDETFGVFSYTNFNIVESMNAIVDNAIGEYYGNYMLAMLVGNKSTNEWYFTVQRIATPEDIPTQLPNPNALTFTGDVTGRYDGSAPLTVEIPSGDSIVPAPSSADNGKYLGCENGAATWKSVEASGGGDISLGLSSASVGQTIKVKAVDENGKPTEWEAAKEKTLKWITVHSSTLTEEATSFSVSADENGKPITDYNPLGIAVALYIPADSTQADNNGQFWVFPQSKMGDNEIRTIGTISGWKSLSRDAVWMWQGGDILGLDGINNNGAVPVYRVSNYVMDGVYLSVRGNGNHLPVGTKAVVTILCEI